MAPTAHLKLQWAQAALGFDIRLESEWSAADGALPRDVHGLVTTYQQVSSAAHALTSLARDAIVVFDEIHHAGDDRAWGYGVQMAFRHAARRIALSGTPFRSDTRAIPFVAYHANEARPDFEYGYGDALRDRSVVRPVEFPRLNGHMEWTGSDGTMHAASFDDPLEASLAAQRLRTALSLDGEWLPAVLAAAHRRLSEVRREQPNAGGLVIAVDQEHARGIASILRDRHGVRPVVATSDDPDASGRIASFRDGAEPWIVAVRMVSEGVDIPRLRVGVFATTTTTELFFRQAVGRLVRWTRGESHQRAYMFIPDDARLRVRAHQMAEQRRHNLRVTDARDALDDPEALSGTAPEEQLSLFAALSAVPVGDVAETEPGANSSMSEFGRDDDPDLLLQLDPLPLLAGDRGDDDPSIDGATLPATPAARRRLLRERNSARVADLARATGMSHAKVNAELNRLAGVRRVTEATEADLRRRLEAANRWMRQL